MLVLVVSNHFVMKNFFPAFQKLGIVTEVQKVFCLFNEIDCFWLSGKAHWDYCRREFVNSKWGKAFEFSIFVNYFQIVWISTPCICLSKRDYSVLKLLNHENVWLRCSINFDLITLHFAYAVCEALRDQTVHYVHCKRIPICRGTCRNFSRKQICCGNCIFLLFFDLFCLFWVFLSIK